MAIHNGNYILLKDTIGAVGDSITIQYYEGTTINTIRFLFVASPSINTELQSGTTSSVSTTLQNAALKMNAHPVFGKKMKVTSGIKSWGINPYKSLDFRPIKPDVSFLSTPLIAPYNKLYRAVTYPFYLTNVAITSIVVSATDRVGKNCDEVKVTVNTDVSMDTISSPVSASVGSTTYSFYMNRDGTSQNVTVVKGNVSTTKAFVVPEKLSDIINISILSSPINETVTIVSNPLVNLTGLLVKQYSIDGTTWKYTNAFTNLTSGTHTAYVKDNYGCQKTKTFKIDPYTSKGGTVLNKNVPNQVESPLLYVSETNSIRFAERIVYSPCGYQKNIKNTLSYEDESEVSYKEIQQFNSCDIVKIQLKTNYETLKIEVLEGINRTVLPTVKLSSHKGLKDKRQATKLDLKSGKTGIYFTTGNIFNYDTDVVEGTYTINGTLPAWGVVGNYVYLDSEWHIIESIYYSESLSVEVLVINRTFSGAVSVTVSSIYSLFDFEVYEFTVDMSKFNDKSIQVKIEGKDTVFSTRTFLSEFIEIKTSHPKTIYIKAKNTTNTDIVYNTGIEHILRLEYSNVSGVIEDETETSKGDDNIKLLSSFQYNGNTFEFSPLTTGIMQMISQILSLDTVLINGQNYIKNAFKIEHLGNSNLYSFEASMTLVKDKNTDGSTTEIGSSTDSVGLIKSGKGYIKI